MVDLGTRGQWEHFELGCPRGNLGENAQHCSECDVIMVRGKIGEKNKMPITMASDTLFQSLGHQEYKNIIITEV